VDGAREKARVLDEERIVDAELLPCDLELVLGRVLVRDEEARRVVRDLEQDHERHEGHRDDEHSRPEAAANHVGDHGRSLAVARTRTPLWRGALVRRVGYESVSPSLSSSA
jgi:hypothetical protein